MANHEKTEFHRQAAVALQPKRDVSEMLSSKVATDKQNNRNYFLRILSSIKYLARQGLPLRGDGDDSTSNFYQLMKLRGEDIPEIFPFLEKKQLKYTSHDIQNEILSIMAQTILHGIVKQIQSSIYFSLMVDETTDVSNREQVVLVFRWIAEDLTVHEDFFGLYQTDTIDAKALVYLIKDTLLRMNLSLEHCRGQCYDGASAMSGIRNGVAKLILDDEPCAVYTHCYGHSLNLAVGDAVKGCKLMKSCLEAVYEISKLIKKSPKRDSLFQKLKAEIAEDTPGFRVLCPTRWTVRAASIQSVLDNHEVLLGVWEESKASSIDSEIRARIIGVETQMESFDFLFGLLLASLLLRHSDNLSKALQHESLSAAEGQHIAKLTLDVLKSLRNDEQFTLFYDKAIIYQNRLGVNPPALPRKRRAPRRLEIGTSEGYHPPSVKDHYRKVYYEALDLVVEGITNRFEQAGYQIYRNLEDLLLKACRGQDFETELDFVCDFYTKDVKKLDLQTQLPLLRALMIELHASDTPKLTIKDIVKSVRDISEVQKVSLCHVWVLFKLLLVMPATNASSEHSFSALRRVKTYLRSTMSQKRLNHLMVLQIHQEAADELDLKAIGNEFVGDLELRKRMLGHFD